MKSWLYSLEIGLAYFIFADSLLAQNDTFVPPSDVSFKISAERKSFRAGEPIALRYRIINISNASLYVPREWEVICPGSPHVWAWFEDSAGKHFVPGYAGSCSINPKTMRTQRLLQSRILRPGLLEDGDVGVSVFPQRQETSVSV